MFVEIENLWKYYLRTTLPGTSLGRRYSAFSVLHYVIAYTVSDGGRYRWHRLTRFSIILILYERYANINYDTITYCTLEHSYTTTILHYERY